MKKNNPKYSQQRKNTIKASSLPIKKKKKNLIIHAIIAFVVPVLLYLQTINFGLTHFDDDTIISKNISILKDFKNVHQAFLTDAFINKSGTFYRPLQTLSYMIDIQLSGGNNTWMYHLSNILLLGSISCLLFLLLMRFLIPPKLALLSTLIFCVHPLFVSSIAWIPARGDLQLTFFSLLSFIFFIDFLQKGKIRYLLLNWVAFTIALFCKETATFLPLIFIIYYFAFHYEKRFEKKYLFNIMLYAISGVFWFWLHSKAINGRILYSNDGLGLKQILSNLRTIPESLAKFFLPFDIAPIPSFSFLKILAGLGIIVLIVILFFKNKEKSKKEIFFCISWFLILMLPPMLYKHPLLDYLDHRFLLPLIGILLFVLFSFPKKWFEKGDIKRSWLMILIFLFLCCCSFTFRELHSYSNPMTFYNSAISKNSNSALAYYNRGNLKKDRSNFQGAIEDYNKAIEISPNHAEAYNNRGNLEEGMGNYSGAIEDYNKAIAINPSYADAYYNRGFIKFNMGDKLGAIEDYNKAIAINLNYANAYNNKGIAMGSIGNLQEAIINFNKAIEINPNYLEAYGNRAFAKYNLKDFIGTIEDCENALKLNSNYKYALNLKAKAQQELQKDRVIN